MSAISSQRHVELQEELLELILKEGFRSFGIADYASRLRCSKTTLYALGDSKEQITLNTIKAFFRSSAEAIEQRTADADGATSKVVVYLRAVADELRRASPKFIADLAALKPAKQIYEQNTVIAAKRVAQLIDEGVKTGEFRRVHASFIADTVAATIRRIQEGSVYEATGLTDAQAFDELAAFVLNGIRS